MAHVARKVTLSVNRNLSRFDEYMEREEQNIVEAMDYYYREQGIVHRPFDVRMGLSETRMSEHDFFLLEDNGKLNIETIVFEDEKEKQLYLQDFRQVRIDALEFPKIRMKHDWE